MALTAGRAILFGAGALLFLVGIAGIAVGGTLAPGGFWALITGGVLMIAVTLERVRYRSEAAERAREPVGPGGGEPGPVEPRFRPTAEVFVDPTSGRRMRVLVDPRTGERRYVAEA